MVAVDTLAQEFEVIQTIVIEGDLPATYGELVDAINEQLDNLDPIHGVQSVSISDIQILVE